MAGTRRSGLGRGLEALIPQAEQEPKQFAMVAVSSIKPNPQQPRTLFDPESLAS